MLYLFSWAQSLARCNEDFCASIARACSVCSSVYFVSGCREASYCREYRSAAMMAEKVPDEVIRKARKGTLSERKAG